MENRINNSIDEICLYYKRKIESLLSICESPIEKMFFVDFIQFYVQSSLSIYSVDFIYKEGFDYCEEIDYGKRNYQRPNYTSENTFSSEFKFENGPLCIYGIKITHKWFKLNFEIIPQYYIDGLENKSFRLDFAIIGDCFSKKTDDKKTEFKIFIECDGYDYHKTPEQINKDNNRANFLKSNGWIEFRYSGKKINEGSFNAAKDFDTFLMKVLKPYQELWDEEDESSWF